MLDVAPITIGAACQIATRVQLLTATHPIDPEARRIGCEYGEPITLADNVWLGGGVIVCPGVSIGKDTVVGAGAVVTKDLPDGVVAAGVPARIMREIGALDRVQVPPTLRERLWVPRFPFDRCQRLANRTQTPAWASDECVSTASSDACLARANHVPVMDLVRPAGPGDARLRPRAHRDHVDEPEQPALDHGLDPRWSIDRDLQAAWPVPVGTLEVDGHDPATAPA